MYTCAQHVYAFVQFTYPHKNFTVRVIRWYVCHPLALCDCPSVCDVLYHTKHQEWRIAHQISQSFHWAEMADPTTQLSTDLSHLLEDQELHTT